MTVTGGALIDVYPDNIKHFIGARKDLPSGVNNTLDCKVINIRDSIWNVSLYGEMDYCQDISLIVKFLDKLLDGCDVRNLAFEICIGHYRYSLQYNYRQEKLQLFYNSQITSVRKVLTQWQI